MKHTTKLVGWRAGWPGMHSCGRRAEELLGGSRPRGAPRPRALGLQVHRAQSLGVALPQGSREETWGRDAWLPILSTALGWLWERGPPTVSEDTVHPAAASGVSITCPSLPQSPDPEWRLETPLCNGLGDVAVDGTGGCGLPLQSGPASRSPALAPAPVPAPKEGAEQGAALWVVLTPTQGPRDPNTVVGEVALGAWPHGVETYSP